MGPSVGIVIPAFRPNIGRLETYVAALQQAVDPETILVELDDPNSGIQSAVATLPVELSVSPERRGKGAAITAGFEKLDTDVLAFADADGATPAASIEDVVARVRDEGADMAVGSRRHPEATIQSHQTYARRRLGDGFAWLARRMLTVHLYDYQCGAKAISADAWQHIRGHLYEPGFAWDIELVAMGGALGFTVQEVPVVWEDQPESTVSTVDTTVELFRALVSVRHRAKLIANHPLHSAIAARRDSPSALVDQVTLEEFE